MPQHIILDYEVEEKEKPEAIKDLRSRQDLDDALEDPVASRVVSCWLITTGRLKEFYLAQRLGTNN
jgi:hypothetical protein